LGDVYEQAGNLDNAIMAFHSAEKIFDKLNEKISQAEALNKLALCYISKGQNDDGIEYYNKAMKLYIDMGNKDGQSAVLEQLGTIYLNQMNISQAIQNYQNSLNIKQELGDRSGRQRILGLMALAYANQKQWMKSAISCVESFQIASQIHSTGVISSLRNILSVSKIMLKESQFAFPAQLAQQLSQIIQNVITSEDQMRTALVISHGVFTIIGFMAACESRKDRDIYKEGLELARSLDERTGAALKLLEWVEEIGL